MLIINKKNSNLLNGYKRITELNAQFHKEWETKLKIEFVQRTNNFYLKSTEYYEKEMEKWRAEELSSIAKFEENKKQELSEWESTEKKNIVSHQAIVDQLEILNQQNQILNWNNDQKWLFISIGSFLCGFGSIFLTFLLSKVSYLFCIFGLLPQLFFGAAIATLITFLGKRKPKKTSISPYTPTPKPTIPQRMINPCPKSPLKPEEFFNKYSCPNLVARWMQEIQYKDEGREYFQEFILENPEAKNGVLGEIALLHNHYGTEDQNNSYIYIPGLKIGPRGDVDGVSISHKGIFILESKYLSGTITLQEGKWKQTIYNKRPGEMNLSGREEKDLPLNFNPENQLTNSIKKIKNILTNFSEKNPWIEKAIKVVLVFTHEDVRLDISNCLVPYGDMMYLSDRYRTTPIVSEMTFEKQLEIVDILLSKNREFEEFNISAVLVAENIYRQSLDFVDKLVESYSNFLKS